MARVAGKVVQVEKGEKTTGPEVRPRVLVLETNRAPALAFHSILALRALIYAEHKLPEVGQHGLVSLILLVVCVHELLLKFIEALKLASDSIGLVSLACKVRYLTS